MGDSRSGPRRRRLILDLKQVAKKAAKRPKIKPEDITRATAGAELINSILGHGGPELDVRSLIEIPDEAFDAAHSILEHQEGNTAETVALRAAAEQIDPDAFADLGRNLLSLPTEPDHTVAQEFI